MRESLTVLAILLIVVLTTALVGPYFVDWNAHRGEIESRLSTLLGARVGVAGPIDVKLLPRPIFRLGQVTVGGDDPAAGTLAARRVDMELSLTALMRGEFSFVDADLSSPVLTLPVSRNGTVRLPHVTASDADRVSLVHLALRNGTVMLLNPDGAATAVVKGVSGEAQAESLLGPFKFTGTAESTRGRLALRVATGTADNGRMRFKATLDATGGLPRVDLDGLLSALAAPAGPGTQLAFEGTASTGGTIASGAGDTVVPRHFGAKLQADAGHVSITDGELRAGAEGRALIAAVTGTLDGGDHPAGNLVVRGRAADLGRLATAPDDADTDATSAGAASAQPLPDATLADILAGLARLGSNADLTAALPFPVTVDAAFDTVAAGAVSLVDVRGVTRLAAGQAVVGTLTAALPDGSKAALEGRFEPGPAAVYKGRVTFATDHLRRLADTVAGDLPAVASAIRQALPVDTVRASGAVDLSAIGVAAHDVALTLDRSTLAGTLTLTRGIGVDRARLFVDLTSDGLDLQALPDWRDTAGAVSNLDLSVNLVAHALRLASGDTGDLNTGRIALRLAKTGPLVTLDRLSVAELGGATAEIKGRADASTAHLDGRIDASRLGALLGVVDRLAPGKVTDALLARAGALSPALLALSADADIGADGSISPTLLTLEGTAAATKVSLRLRPEAAAATALDPSGTSGSSARDMHAVPPFAADLTLDAPDATALLRQAGFATAGGSVLGHGRLEASAHRDPSGVTTGSLTAALGDTIVKADGRGDAAGHVSAKVALRGANVAPLTRALSVATPEPGAVWPILAGGTVALADGRFATQDFTGSLIGTGFRANLAYVAPPSGSQGAPDTGPALTGTLAVDRLPLPVLAGLVLGPLPAAKSGTLWPDQPFGPALLTLPRGEIAVTAPSLPVWNGLTASNASTTLRIAPGVVTLADLDARIGEGRLGGTVTMRRDGTMASLAGHVEWSGVPIASPSLGGLSQGALDLAGSGTAVSAMVASLAGSGTLEIANARLPRFDPGAASRVIASTDAAGTTVDEGAIAASLGQELDRGALPLGAVATPVTVAAGALRVPAVRATAGPVVADASGALDLGTLLLTLRSTATVVVPPKDWVGPPPQVTVNWRGPFGNPAREVGAATLVNGIAARAIARDQARIEAFQDDVRERARFANQLRRIEADQQAARDRAKAATDAERQRLQQLIQGIGPDTSFSATGLAPTPAPQRRPGPAATAKPLEVR